ncbi:LA_2272 family surface repeat-containing protein [Thaumasiovibrio subtropicus]|uniref:LA_2272 family surface repeat-containing protein n=1 Tax=Thaumasiovibrio subtropicus TaxID=1891207 RepID=UPI000B35D2B8|nr:hypothetical protein [Thaumasiovibrio subtropicus]
MKRTVVSLLLAAAFSTPAMAADATQPFQLSVPGHNLPEGDVKGFRATVLYGQTTNVTGLNLALFGLAESQHFTGLSLDFFGANRTTESSLGLKVGLANWNDGTAKGVELGFANYTGGEFTGLQWGAVNYAGRLNGLQLGLFNATDRIEQGIQIGFINYDKSGTFVSEDLPVFPIINARF